MERLNLHMCCSACAQRGRDRAGRARGLPARSRRGGIDLRKCPHRPLPYSWWARLMAVSGAARRFRPTHRAGRQRAGRAAGVVRGAPRRSALRGVRARARPDCADDRGLPAVVAALHPRRRPRDGQQPAIPRDSPSRAACRMTACSGDHRAPMCRRRGKRRRSAGAATLRIRRRPDAAVGRSAHARARAWRDFVRDALPAIVAADPGVRLVSSAGDASMHSQRRAGPSASASSPRRAPPASRAHVQLLGGVERRTLDALYRSADLHVFPVLRPARRCRRLRHGGAGSRRARRADARLRGRWRTRRRRRTASPANSWCRAMRTRPRRRDSCLARRHRAAQPPTLACRSPPRNGWDSLRTHACWTRWQ